MTLNFITFCDLVIGNHIRLATILILQRAHLAPLLGLSQHVHVDLNYCCISSSQNELLSQQVQVQVLYGSILYYLS